MSNTSKKTAVALSLFFLSAVSCAREDNMVCVVYFTGNGCPHCAKTDPTVLGELPLKYDGSLVVIEYEVYQNPENAQLMREYQEKMGMGRGIPQVVYSKGLYVSGDSPILKSIDGMIEERLQGGSACPLLDSPAYFKDLNVSALPGKPTIWFKDRVLFRAGDNADTKDNVLRGLLFSEKVSQAVWEFDGVDTVSPEPVPLSGSEVLLSNAVRFGGWMLEWNGNEKRSGGRVENTSLSSHLLTRTDTYFKYLLAFCVIALLLMFIQEKRTKKK